MTFHFYMGGFFRKSYDLELVGKELICYEYTTLSLYVKPIIVDLKGNELWHKVIQYLSECNWNGHYNNSASDIGTQWSIDFANKDITVNAEGSNAYPPDFNKILSLLNEIADLDMQF